MATPYLFYFSAAAVILSIGLRKQEIGGLLMYFYWWIFGLVYSALTDLLLHYRVFLPSRNVDPGMQAALVLAVLPRLLVYLSVASIAVMLLKARKWEWVERLRIALIAGIMVAGVSLVLDFRYFPTSIKFNGARWIGLCLWLIYFVVSKRVHHVFRTNDWDKFGGEVIRER